MSSLEPNPYAPPKVWESGPPVIPEYRLSIPPFSFDIPLNKIKFLAKLSPDKSIPL